MPSGGLVLLARKFLPVTRPAIDNGALALNDGKITALGRESEILKKFKGDKIIDLGECLVMPGLVNLHTHLELSHLHGRLSGEAGFFDWIEALVELRRKTGTKGQRPAAARALVALLKSGTTCIGDISSTDAVLPDIVRSRIRAVVFLEVLGRDKAKADEIFDALLIRLAGFKGLPGRIKPGISPHAPYSVSSILLAKISDYTSSNNLDIATHLSEIKDEMLHFKGRPSRFDGYMKRFGWDGLEPDKGKTSLQFLREFKLDHNLLAVHAVHVTKGDMEMLRRSGATVAHCPRSNQNLGVGKAPVEEFLARGINVGIGTDSLASNKDLNLWEEMRLAHIINKISAKQVIEMATINGAMGLGLGNVTGSIEPGKDADLIAISTTASKKKDPYPQLLETECDDIVMTMVQGRLLHLSGSLKDAHGL